MVKENQALNKEDVIQLICVALVIALVAFFAGYTIGGAQTMSLCVDIGMKVLEKSGFEISPTILHDIINRYGGHI